MTWRVPRAAKTEHPHHGGLADLAAVKHRRICRHPCRVRCSEAGMGLVLCGEAWGSTVLLNSDLIPQDYDHFNLEVGYEDGRDRVLLWLPTICKHVITDDSPLASWQKPSGIMADADASIVVVVSHRSQ